ncbi:DUF2161 domain-containing phosphodiesterase [Pararhodobacter zhoushanensis]|uniref:DUF2161 family putative PD-(D/E)XK-type phosphodiesterase n=1 Tax=Pararhodobacter zhoushanensis TaxID=2479545 RepID=A0ABT3H107_9RHOB|nr:DUF2161 family putative PD-(D/E)XK-type phosphodiesterase [Pararhodobacter zhoushanensis]MCW1933503.1 DUF2161 family putative PD-(D/E)XK-type phosphodiesterase [Pararhodobacter zhoushanensis]
MTVTREADLYPPLKAHFEARGLTVKGEIGAADLVAMGGADPVIVEMKLKFSLALYHQGIARLALSPQVYLAVLRPEGAAARRMIKENTALCRRLGLGLITVRGRDGFVEVLAEPGPYAPRGSKVKRGKLEAEFARRQGDPNAGGATRHGLVTGYRQDALRCAAYLAEYGAAKGAAVARDTGVPVATRIMADNHYGWFERVSTGVYGLTTAGRKGLADWDGALPE